MKTKLTAAITAIAATLVWKAGAQTNPATARTNWPTASTNRPVAINPTFMRPEWREFVTVTNALSLVRSNLAFADARRNLLLQKGQLRAEAAGVRGPIRNAEKFLMPAESKEFEQLGQRAEADLKRKAVLELREFEVREKLHLPIRR